ncbi:hypothetical protein ACYFX5_16965 [Bremerella sp. T1]|uniref:hypothetical protein n=1 Tax=Bremerella sp. TYQ1 TaxID=3119568 RepID=UPI001CC942B0|nr:hypothetical protein [Bremerella volcania]UBM34751.1 hypothetical protein LA756_18915 [Bremerella volcania]
MNDEQRAAIERWRKRQIYCVAAGNLAAIMFLMGIALGSRILLGIGAVVFLGCLGGIFVGGFFASQAAKSSSS